MGNLITCNSDSVEDDLQLSLHKLLKVMMAEFKKDILHCIQLEITKSNATNSKSDSEPPIKD